MTDRNELQNLKALAKRYARANRVPLHQALKSVAAELGFPHWKAVTNAVKESWHPSQKQMLDVEAFVHKTAPALQYSPSSHDSLTLAFSDDEKAEEGKIGPHPYRIEEALDDVHLSGKGWHIQIGEAPSAEPVVEVTDKRFKSNPIHDPEFVKEALAIAHARAKIVRARISSDWPRRSTKPDAEGRARHPLFGGLSNEWFCLHCDGKFAGAEMAKNMWHCPSCSATPLKIFSSPFWLMGAE